MDPKARIVVNPGSGNSRAGCGVSRNPGVAAPSSAPKPYGCPGVPCLQPDATFFVPLEEIWRDPMEMHPERFAGHQRIKAVPRARIRGGEGSVSLNCA